LRVVASVVSTGLLVALGAGCSDSEVLEGGDPALLLPGAVTSLMVRSDPAGAACWGTVPAGWRWNSMGRLWGRSKRFVHGGEEWKSACGVGRSDQGRIFTYGSAFIDDVTPLTNSSGVAYANPSNSFIRRVNGVSQRWDIHAVDPDAPSVLAEAVFSEAAQVLSNFHGRDCSEFLLTRCVLTRPEVDWSKWTTWTSCRDGYVASTPALLARRPRASDGVLEYQCTAAGVTEAASAGWQQRQLELNFSAPLTGTPSSGSADVPEVSEVVDGCAQPGSLRGALDAWLVREGLSFTELVGHASVTEEYNGTIDDEHDWGRAFSYVPTACAKSPFESVMEDHLPAVVDVFTSDPTESGDLNYGHLLHKIQLNGEEGYLPTFENWGFVARDTSVTVPGVTPAFTTEELADSYQRLGELAVARGLPREKLLINIQGGGVYRPLVEAAFNSGFGVGAHGPTFPFDYKALQFLDRRVGSLGAGAHLEYDERSHAVRMVDESPFPYLHTDLEALHPTSNTLGQYTMFQMAALAALSEGFNSLTVSGDTIPSAGVPQALGRCGGDEGCENYDHAQIAALGAEEFLEWMHRSVGRNLEDRIDAWCWLGEMGSPPDDPGDSFYDRYAEMEDVDPRLIISGAFDDVRSPLRTHIGSGCTLDPAFAGSPSRQLTPENQGTAVGEDLVQTGTGASFAHWVWTGKTGFIGTVRNAAADTWTAWPYAARSGERLDLVIDTDAQVFRGADLLVVSITYAHPLDGDPGDWRLELRRGSATASVLNAPPVVRAEAGTPVQGIYTANLYIPSAGFLDRRGRIADRLSLISVSETGSTDFLFVRVTPVELGP
jgi:hypothetical protein